MSCLFVPKLVSGLATLGIIILLCRLCMHYVMFKEWKALHALTTFYKYRVKCATCVVQSILLSETKQLKFSWTESVKCLQICSEWCVIDYCEHNYYTL